MESQSDKSEFTAIGTIDVIQSKKGAADPRNQTKVRDNDTSTGTQWPDIAPWGDDNLFPQNLIDLISMNTMVAPLLGKISDRIYGGGIVAGVHDIVDGEMYFKQQQFTEFEDFKTESNFNKDILKACRYLPTYYNVYPEYNFGSGGMCTKVNVIPSQKVRLFKEDSRGQINKCRVNPDWKDHNSAYDTDIQTVMDYYKPWMKINELKGKSGWKNKVVVPLTIPGFKGGDYYECADWDVMRSSGWLEYFNSIIGYKKSILDNQVALKYLVWVAPEFMRKKFPEWDQNAQDPVFVKTKYQEVLDEFNTLVNDPKSAGSSLLMPTAENPDGSMRKLVEFEDISNNYSEGHYIEDSREASSHLSSAIQVDPALYGSGPGKNQTSSGSGSDKRTAYNIMITDMKAKQDAILRIPYIVKQLNGWPSEMQFAFKSTLISTLDTGSSTTDGNTESMNNPPREIS